MNYLLWCFLLGFWLSLLRRWLFLLFSFILKDHL